jgi:hypothetical protein
MALPLVPFVVGAAAGSAATYIYKDKEVRDSLVKSSLHYLSYLNPMKKKAEKAEKVDSETIDAESIVEDVEQEESESEQATH